MTGRINLLPPELARKRRARQQLAAVVASGVALAVALVAVYALQEMRLRSEQDRLAEQQSINDGLRAEIAALVEYDELERRAEARQALLADLTAAEVRWSGLLADVSLAIPNNAWLTSFTGSLSARAGEEIVTIGEIQMGGFTFEHVDVARWLTRLADVPTFRFPYASLSARTELHEQEAVQFNSSVQLGEEALRARGREGGRRL